MENETKQIDIKEFREKGYLQEINRRFLHPLGLALVVNTNNGKEVITGVLDCRDDEEGIYYDIKNSDLERKNSFMIKKAFIDKELELRNQKRKEILEFDIEPIE